MHLAQSTLLPEISVDSLSTQAQQFRQATIALLHQLDSLPDRPGLALFLDEIDMLLEQPAYYEFAAVLRSTTEDARCRGRVTLLAAGLDSTLNRLDRIAGGRNPLFAFFAERPLGLLEPEDARTMIVSLGGQMGVSFTGDALETLVAAGGGHPFPTRQLCSHAIRGLERPVMLDQARAAAAIDAYLRLARSYLSESLWAIDTGGPPVADATLLRSLTDSSPRTEAALIADDLLPEERRKRQLALDRLSDLGILKPSEAGWALAIPLYEAWIRRTMTAPPHRAVAENQP